MDVPTEL